MPSAPTMRLIDWYAAPMSLGLLRNPHKSFSPHRHGIFQKMGGGLDAVSAKHKKKVKTKRLGSLCRDVMLLASKVRII